MIIEIYERKTGNVIETKDIGSSLRGFSMYWSSQANTKRYAYRQVTQ